MKELRLDAHCSRFPLPTAWHLIANEKKSPLQEATRAAAVKYNSGVCIYMHVITITEKRRHEVERDQTGTHERFWGEEREDRTL